MGKTSTYFRGKLFDINYAIGIHEGTAKRRLRSLAPKILFQLSETEVPSPFRKEFHELLALLKNSSRTNLLRAKGLRTLTTIQNVTAAKYIKMMLDMQHYLDGK
jgi:hypothetical protein